MAWRDDDDDDNDDDAQKMSSGSFKNIINKMCLEIIDVIYMYREDLALNNLQGLRYHKPKQANWVYHLLDKLP